jgi:hypothetical protein
MRHLGLRDSTIGVWIETGYLEKVLPRVYAIGHRAPNREADLWAAILYAGPGAALSHATAAHWRGLIDYPPRQIEVSTPRKIASHCGVQVYARRRTERTTHNALPITSIPRMLLDLAAIAEQRVLRRALAQLDYRRELDVEAISAICRSGRTGSRKLRLALTIHNPRLAHVNGPLEYGFMEFCERSKLPLPQVNVRVHGILVDAYWPQQKLVVELDGLANHSTPAQLRRDKANDLKLRGHGLTVIRYDWDLVHGAPRRLHDDLIAALEPGQQVGDSLDRGVRAL